MVSSLSVVIPAYNEEKNISTCINSVYSVLKKTSLDWEIIVVNDGSKDKTREVAESFYKRIKNLKVVTNNHNRGYGGSLKAGFSASTKEFITFFPADNQFDFNDIHKLIALQNSSGSDIVSGIRVGGGADPLHRKINRWGWNTVVRALFGYLASDIDCGFKLFRREILKQINIPAERGAMIDTQLFASARVRGFTVSETSLTHLPRTAGLSTGANPRVIIQSFLDLFKFWWQLKQEILVERGLAVFKWEALIILVIILVAGFLRIYKIDQHMTFLGDEGRDAIVMRKIMTGKHFPLVGPGTSIGNMYLGPLYYYLVAPSLWIFNYSPVGPSVFVATVGLMTIGLVWWVGRQWFGRFSALLIALLYGISPTVIIYSRSSWNPNVMPFFALLTMYGIWKIWRFGYWRWLLISTISFAFVLNSHYLGLLLVLPILIFLLLSPNKLDAKRYSLISMAILVFLMSPLFLFDWRHDWQNFSAMKTFFTARQETVNLKAYKAIPNLWPIWQNVVTNLVAGRDKILGWVAAFGIFDLSLLYLIRHRNRDLVFVSTWLGFSVLGLGLYKQHIYDHYYGIIFPAIFLLLGFLINYLSKNLYLKIFTIISALVLIGYNIVGNSLRFEPNDQLNRTRQIAEFINKNSGNKPFNLALISKRNYDASYRYFLSLEAAPYFTIHDKLADQLFVICEPADCEPINNPLWEVAAFGWAKIDNVWNFPWDVSVYRLIHNLPGK